MIKYYLVDGTFFLLNFYFIWAWSKSNLPCVLAYYIKSKEPNLLIWGSFEAQESDF